MVPITVFARMFLRAPFTGARVFLASLPWLLPVALGLVFAQNSAAAERFASANAVIAGMIEGMVTALGGQLVVPGWVDPIGWAPLFGAVLVWLYVSQRDAMKRVGVARPSPGRVAYLRNMVEWMLLGCLLPAMVLVLVFGGAILGSSIEFAEPYNIYALPSAAEIFGARIEEYGRGLWFAYRGEPFLIVLIAMLLFVMAGRYMALHSAFVGGDDVRGKPARLPVLMSILSAAFVHYFVAVAVVWTFSEIGGFEIKIWGLMALHFGLMWCSMAAAAGYATTPEIERSLEVKAFADDVYSNAQGGAMPDEKPGCSADDDLAQALKAFEASRAA